MNKYEILAAQAKTYAMLASVTKSIVYAREAKKCLEMLRSALKNDGATKTMELKKCL